MSGKRLVTLMVQIPDSFSTAQPCIVTATSSGSRGIYGAIGTAGEWGLKHGCAVAYTDKGSGNGMHDLARDTVNLIDGTVSSASAAGKRAHFAADMTKTQLDAFNARLPQPHRLQARPLPQNPEKDWGRNTLDAVGFAFYVLNEKIFTGRCQWQEAPRHPPGQHRGDRLVGSNGAGAALMAAEQDSLGLIDGVAVSEPQIQPKDVSGVGIKQGTAASARSASR
jgi:hydroxybutyrate-dimer hydrolase